MLQNLFVVCFLIGSACAMHLEYLKVDTEEHVDGALISASSDGLVGLDEDLPMPEAQFPGVCWACKWVMTKLKKHLGNHESANKIREKLKKVCDSIGLLKDVCVKMVDKNIDTLVEELSTTDDPKTICANIRACKEVDLMELIQAFPQNYQNL